MRNGASWSPVPPPPAHGRPRRGGCASSGFRPDRAPQSAPGPFVNRTSAGAVLEARRLVLDGCLRAAAQLPSVMRHLPVEDWVHGLRATTRAKSAARTGLQHRAAGEVGARRHRRRQHTGQREPHHGCEVWLEHHGLHGCLQRAQVVAHVRVGDAQLLVAAPVEPHQLDLHGDRHGHGHHAPDGVVDEPPAVHHPRAPQVRLERQEGVQVGIELLQLLSRRTPVAQRPSEEAAQVLRRSPPLACAVRPPHPRQGALGLRGDIRCCAG